MNIRKIIITEKQFLNNFNNGCLITENRASKNQSLARRMVRELSPDLDDKEFTMKVLHDIPNVRKADFHLFPAAVRLLLQSGDTTDGEFIQKLNKYIGIIAPKAKELGLDQNINGMSTNEFFNNFNQDVEQEDNLDRQTAAKYGNGDGKFGGYDIVFIPDFQSAEEYGDYVDWCITYNEGNFNQYTNNETGYFYFFLKKGYQNITKKDKDNYEAPLDKYGLSMIAVSFYEDGEVNTITGRWNHEFQKGEHGGDHLMSVSELCNLINADVYKICVDKRPKKEIPSSWKLIKKLPHNQTLYYDNDKKDYLVSDKNIRKVVYFEGEKVLEYNGFGVEGFDALILTNGVIIGGKDVFISGYFFVGDKLYVSLDFNIYEVDTNSGHLTQSPNLKSFSVRDGYVILTSNESKMNILYPDTNQLLFTEWVDNIYVFGKLVIVQKNNTYSIVDIVERKYSNEWLEKYFFNHVFYVFKTPQNKLIIYTFLEVKHFGTVDEAFKVDDFTIAVKKNDKYYYLMLKDKNSEVSVHELSKEEYELYK